MTYISDGNKRMIIPTFCLISGHTCPNATHLCKKNCYAKKAERIYPTAYITRLKNTFDSLKDSFVDEISDILKTKASKYIRIHESGDFYSQKYLEKWFKICRLFPDKKFLVYSQMHNLDWSNKPNNLIVYWSIWPDTKIIPKIGLKAYVIDNGNNRIPNYKSRITGHLCSKGKGSTLTCDKCMYCFRGKGNVRFKIH